MRPVKPTPHDFARLLEPELRDSQWRPHYDANRVTLLQAGSCPDIFFRL